MNRWVTFLGFIGCIIAGNVGRAALIEVDIVDAVLTAGSSGYIDVVVKGTGAPIVAFGYTLTISGAGPGFGNVVFTTQVFNMPTINDPRDYVFYGNSSNQSVQASNTELTGNDVLDAGEVNVDDEYLLARLNIQHQGELGENIPEATFTFSVTQATFYFSVVNEESVEVFTPYDLGDVTLGAGTLKIVATPEPATLGFLGIASIFAARRIQLRRRKSAEA